MPSVRCESFNELLWAYVAEVAKIKKTSRCKALENIVLEHMKFMADEENRRRGKVGKKKTKK